jgi:hypothetical protein
VIAILNAGDVIQLLSEFFFAAFFKDVPQNVNLEKHQLSARVGII